MRKPPISGVYQIRCLLDNKVYVGSTMSLSKRKCAHFALLKRNTHHSRYLQSAYNKHGLENFVWEVVELCSVDLLAEREQFHIDKYPNNMRYNHCPAAYSNAGMKYSEESKAEMSRTRKGRCFVTPEDLEKRAVDYPSYTSPDGVVYPPGHNRSRFAKEHGLDNSKLKGLEIGRGKSHRGWTLTGYNTRTKIYPSLLSPDGYIVEIYNMTKFCKNYKLTHGKMSELVNKRLSIYKGWTVLQKVDF